MSLLKNRPRVIEDLVPGYTEYRYLMFMLPILLGAEVIVETGLGYGESTRIFLEALSFKGSGELHTYTYETNFGGITIEQTEKEIRDLNLKAKWYLHVRDSVNAGIDWQLPVIDEEGWDVTNPTVDLLYLDSAHEYQHVYNELEAWEPCMSQRSVIFTDDTWHTGSPHMAINTKHPGTFPTDVYHAFEDWQDKHHDWYFINFSFPNGKSFLLRDV